MHFVKAITRFVIKYKIEIFIAIYFVLMWYVTLPGFYSHDSFYHLFQSNKHIYDVTTGPLFTMLIDMFWNSGFPIISLLFLNTFPIIILYIYFVKNNITNVYSRNHKIFYYIILLLAITSPVVISYNVTLWKDVPYSIIFVLLLLFLYKIQFKINNKYRILIVTLLTIFLVFLRINGFLVLIPIAILVITNLKYRITLIVLVLFISALSLFLGVKSGVIDTSRFPLFSSYLKLQLVAAYAKNNISSFSLDEKNNISEFVSLDSLKNSYNCFAVDYAYFANSTFKESYFNNESNNSKFNETFVKLTLKNIPTVISDRICLMLNTVGFAKVEDSYYLPPITDRNKEVFGVNLNDETSLNINNNLSYKISEKFSNLLISSTNSILRLFYWTLFFNIIAIIVFYFKTNNKSLKKAILFVMISLILLITINVSRDFRYLYYLHLVTPFLIILYFKDKNVKDDL